MTVFGFHVIERSSYVFRSLRNGYGVMVQLAKDERDPDFEEWMAIGDGWTRDEAYGILGELKLYDEYNGCNNDYLRSKGIKVQP